MEHDKLSVRLSQILTKLNNGEKFTLEDLAQEFNVSSRTVERDIKERLNYLPLKKEGKYYFLEEYALGKLNLEDIKNFATISGIKSLYPVLNIGFMDPQGWLGARRWSAGALCGGELWHAVQTIRTYAVMRAFLPRRVRTGLRLSHHADMLWRECAPV